MIKINLVVLIGRLTKDPELKFTTTGKAVCTFNIAVTNPWIKDKDKNTDFFKITVFDKLAETTANNLTKGRLVSIQAKLKNNKYVDGSGTTRYTTEIISDTVQYLDSKKNSQNNTESSYDSGNYSGGGGYTEMDDGDIPF